MKDNISIVIVCALAAAVIISLFGFLWFGISQSSHRYHESMARCIEARGTWFPTQSTGACIIVNQ